MTNLIEKVAELRKLEGRRQSILERQRGMGTPNHSLREQLELEHEMRNAAPKLLDALENIQAGDATMLDGIIRYLIEDFEEGEHSCQMVAWLVNHRDDTRQDMIDLLRRLRDLARQMEANHE